MVDDRKGSTAFDSSLSAEFLRSVEIMQTLRSKNGCPWDLEQDHHSLKKHLLEEAYEVVHAIELEETDNLKEELGDLLLQVLFHAQIAAEAGEFDICSVLRAINDKLVRRHPHIYGNVEADSPEQVKNNWEAIKDRENERKGHSSALDGVPTAMPSLMLATKLQSKAARVGFDWDDIDGVFAKVDEEIAELKAAVKDSHAKQIEIEEEVGDVLFTLANLARHLSVDAEEAARSACMKFVHRFKGMEASIVSKSGYPKDLQSWDTLWNEVKSAECRVERRSQDNE